MPPKGGRGYLLKWNKVEHTIL